MDSDRKAMERALRGITVPSLREAGFQGSFPHFRRLHGEHLELLSFQFSSSGGKFCVELGLCGKDGLTTSWGEHVSPSKVNVQYAKRSARLGATVEGGDHWYEFSGPDMTGDAAISSLAKRVVLDVADKARAWWDAEIAGEAGS